MRVLTALLFFIWILPLGVFIKPSQEKLACNGQRAICLCSHSMAKSSAKPAGQTIHKGSGGLEEKNSSVSAGHYFILILKKDRVDKQLAWSSHQQSLLYSFRADRLIDPVPKI